ncbi:hybrid sensor histidine kinase/response regulator [Aggregatibacter actinomycetemcomitans]|uniref:Aerobic respiration control sensor protein n=2 Tax=Aggregatibacter actinomycetemcomitans TaxID=714 RepID=A0AAC8Y0A9_AGGAC|nr:ATP-binding protein [Aggregatibacter actinomycetemcomitans]AFI87286.1 ATPase [Aggregatibacter actinomycetemcomitans D7S-1]AMQ94436.1 ATPase [Aggregatibacter actinomycetemcomitans]ANU81453.1 hybrid sensor histidine kinase/response regulator [Aggregatibacter actinomycetemcomitans]EKX97883.1 ATPase/histidine kinase/DNA gyrase B/HSP90 domain protein [Aggregatibacter actinomycetemcomitans Y4]KND83035.1 ATPase [Aggregatibacter actinomycetemcomitans serotype a str. H5P1]
MKNLKDFVRRYVDWVIRLGRIRFSLLGVMVLAVLALCTQILLSLLVMGKILWADVARSIVFGLISAPFVIYFFTVLVEKLEHSRQALSCSVEDLRREVQERVSAEKKLSEALDNLEKINRDKTTLMTTISHELRTPLNGIIGLSRILLEENPSERQQNYLKTINSSALSLAHIFSDIIDLEKIDAKRIELNRKATDLYALLNDIANFALLMTEEKHLQFQLVCPPTLPNWLMLDGVRLNQVLWNLINNAVKFTQQGSVTLSVEQTAEEEFALRVTDTGIGIAEQDLQKIFELYYQAGSDANKSLGSGIGLSVSKTIAQLMGGDLTVSSEVGKGSTFLFTFKARQAIKPVEEDEHLPLKLNILLVEDIEVNVVVAKSMLEKLGYQIDIAMTGAEAIRKFEQNYYDLVFLDIQLPDMSGFDIAAHFRQNYENGVYDFLPPLIALTANVVQKKQEYLAQGMDDVIHKPLSLEELRHCLHDYFGEELAQFNLPSNKPQAESVELDTKMLTELVEMLGADFVKNNLILFERTMQDYVAELQQAYQTYLNDPHTQPEVLSIAHKIKGALASMGLKRLQWIAAQAQNADTADWQGNIAHWVNLLAKEWQTDVVKLREWLAGY